MLEKQLTSDNVFKDRVAEEFVSLIVSLRSGVCGGDGGQHMRDARKANVFENCAA
jgi:hypothetical protein